MILQTFMMTLQNSIFDRALVLTICQLAAPIATQNARSSCEYASHDDPSSCEVAGHDD